MGQRASTTPVQQARDTSWDYRYVWHIVAYSLVLYPVGLYGGYLFLVAAKWQTDIFTLLLYMASILGTTAGAHRLWSHRSYKAKWPLQLILMIFQTIALQYSAINWARDHRMHHKYVDTDADPHNATRGLFFSHLGWLMVDKHPEFERKIAALDVSDLEANPILRFQQKYYVILATISIVLPIVVPVYFWDETWTNAFFVTMWFHHFCTYNAIALVNSALHKWGYKPYDKHMLATDTSKVCLVLLGESFHNYHHAFPWDYKAAEFGGPMFNFSSMFIEFFAKIGWAYDLKTVSNDVIQKRVTRTGDGSHHIWGWGDKDLLKEDVDAAIRINPKDE
ncbi:acyl-CoA Delta-9 desaturase-like [Leguminivora glycinivorella]|uniref:acyl-CoA Delta-9 desaturase-like n=1 Tax=Leguminivora glycinivorella TaxID=1035111 RepID=UPI00200BBDDA|nr:acyl-CoA Delta-9 desaturase-like [Leguminivora glycinivorella]